jgi:hypothetical protein
MLLSAVQNLQTGLKTAGFIMPEVGGVIEAEHQVDLAI